MTELRLLLPLLLLALAACIPSPDGDRGRRGAQPQPQPVRQSATMKACTGELNRLNANYTVLPDATLGAGCSTSDSVQLLGIGVPVTNVTAIRCNLARNLAQWAQGPLQAAARASFGERIVKIETMGAYSCRNIIGGSGTGRSQHATANAVDVSAFVLGNGRRVTVQSGWNGAADERRFLREIRNAACQQFGTVLSPDYNAAHYNHFHFDNSGQGFCR
ncbi:MAG: extensin family protein [Parasphingorhabdus sp.]|nr:extensin family protein [Parasphingorhabdus sp.]